MYNIGCDSEAEGTEGECTFCHKEGTDAAFFIYESGGISFKHPTEGKNGPWENGEEEYEGEEEDADWDNDKQAIE